MSVCATKLFPYLCFIPAILTCDHFGEPVDESGNPLDPEHMIEADRCKLKGLIVDNVSMISLSWRSILTSPNI